MIQSGPNTQETRIFINIFGKAAQRAGILRPTLEEYLKQVYEDSSSNDSHRYRARIIFTNLLQQAGEDATLPDYAVAKPSRKKKSNPSQEERPLEDPPSEVKDKESLDALLDFPLGGLSEKDNLIDFSMASIGMDTDTDTDLARPEPLGQIENLVPHMYEPVQEDLFNPTPEPIDPVRERLLVLLEEFLKAGNTPFVRIFPVNNVRYVAVGSIAGTVQEGSRIGESRLIQYVINEVRDVRASKTTYAYHVKDRPLEVRALGPENSSRTLTCLNYFEGMTLRYWARIGKSDVLNSRRVFRIANGMVNPIP